MSEVLDIRLPELSGGSEAQQLRQLQRYLYSLAGQLQYAFDSVSREQEQTRLRMGESRKDTPAETFSSIKSLIIKSADIVEAYSEETERRLAGRYVAQSEFGTYSRETEHRIVETGEEVRRSFRQLQELSSAVESVSSALVEVNACIRTGMLYETSSGTPMYGVEIGQQEHRDGVICFRKYARLTAERLSFYDSSDTEVAWISDRQLHITDARIYTLSAAEASLDRVLRIGDYTVYAAQGGHLTVSG